MTTDPTNPSDPSTPPPTTPPPTTPPPTTPPPVGTDPYAAPPAPDAGAYAPPAAPTGGAYTAPAPTAPDYGTAPTAGSTGSGFDLAKTSTSDKGIAAAAILFLVALLLTWASISFDDAELPGVGGLDTSQNGISSGLLVFAWILLLAAGAVALLPAFGAQIKLPFPRPLALVGLTGLAALITLFGFIDAITAPDEVDQLEDLGIGVGYSAGIGAYLGMVIAIAAVVLAVMAFRSAPRAEATA